MSCECDWCEYVFEPEEIGIVRITEIHPIFEGHCDDEQYNFCSYKCLRKWIEL